MPLKIADLAHRAGYSVFAPILRVVIVGVAFIDTVALYCDSAGLRFAKAKFYGNIIGAEIFIGAGARIDTSRVGALVPCELG
jgi:hypothetical protein